MNFNENLSFSKNSTKEGIIKKIEQKKINIEKFEGFLIWTQIPNIPGILKEGINPISDRKQVHWKYGGKFNHPAWENHNFTYMTIYDPSLYSFKDGDYPWPEAGQVGILLDKDLDKKSFEGLKNISLKNLVDKNYIENFYDKKIMPKNIHALVLNKNIIQLENPKNTKSIKIPTIGGKTETGKINLPFSFSNEQYIKMLKTRLDRLIGTEYEKNLVPLYNSYGEIIWP